MKKTVLPPKPAREAAKEVESPTEEKVFKAKRAEPAPEVVRPKVQLSKFELSIFLIDIDTDSLVCKFLEIFTAFFYTKICIGN